MKNAPNTYFYLLNPLIGVFTKYNLFNFKKNVLQSKQLFVKLSIYLRTHFFISTPYNSINS